MTGAIEAWQRRACKQAVTFQMNVPLQVQQKVLQITSPPRMLTGQIKLNLHFINGDLHF